MNFLRTGHFFGNTNGTITLGGITLTNTDTEQTQEHVDWHYHENAYFTFILEGKLIEAYKKKNYICSAGSLLFHSSQEPHYNVKPKGNTRCFHIEYDNKRFDDSAFNVNNLQGIFTVDDPDIKFLFYKAFRETKICDDITVASIEIILFEIFGRMLSVKQFEQHTRPVWVKKLKDILHESYSEKFSLANLSRELDIHPVHLSRDFSKHFHCTLSEYVRKLRVEKSLSLMSDKNLSLTEIAFKCGFADQSHFLRSFKVINGINPSAYRNLLVE